MTDDELKQLVAETSRVAAENSRAVAENSRAVAENSRAVAENSRAIREMREEFERRWQDSQRQWQESREEILASRQETDRLITSLERRLGEIGNAFGLYTESMFQPSLKRILREQFGMTVITAPQSFQINGADAARSRPASTARSRRP